jgi:cytosine/adenosine deaminase-related metal-dependent hydrolase
MLVHAVAAMHEPVRDLIHRRRSAIVWCPRSNLFTLGRTLPLEVFASDIRMALGTDSALTAQGDLIDELCVARRVAHLEAARLYRMVTSDAAELLRLPSGTGHIAENGPADLIAIRDRGLSPASSLFGMQVELVMIGGKAKLVSADLARRIPQRAKPHLEPISVEDRGEYLIATPVRRMLEITAECLGEPVSLAGRRVHS